MDVERGEQELVEEIVAEHARAADDLVEVDAHTWAIHGFIGVDGDVLLAEFDTRAAAEQVLGDLPVEGGS